MAVTRRTGRPVVLCVDDEPGVLAALQRLLSREPYEVLATVDPAEALRRVEEQEISLLLVDQRMPDMKGTDLLKQVRERSPRTMRVMITAHLDACVLASRLHEGVQHVITKPWDNARLRNTIAGLLRERENHRGDETRRIRLNCRELSASDALRSLGETLRGLASGEVVIELDGVVELGSDVNEFLTSLVAMIEQLGLCAVIVDPSGTAEQSLKDNASGPKVVTGPLQADPSDPPAGPPEPPVALAPARAPGESPDNELMNRAVHGDRAAYGELFHRHAASIWRMTYLLLHSAIAADDAVQDVFLRGLDRIKTYRGEAPPKSWFCAIALNLCRHQLRNESGHAHAVDPLMLESAQAVRREPQGVFSSILRQESSSLLVEALALLDQTAREIFVLHYLENLSYDEIADLLGTTAGAARVQSHRARNVLKGILGPDNPLWTRN